MRPNIKAGSHGSFRENAPAHGGRRGQLDQGAEALWTAFANLLSPDVPSRAEAVSVTEVELRTIKEVDMKGGTVVAAFPSVGLVSTITATYLITTLPTDQVTALESPDFPSISMIYASKPKFPAPASASRKEKLAIFICEMPLPMSTHRPVAYALMKWAKDHGCRQIVPLERS